MPYGFRFLLVTPDDAPYEPALLLSAVHNYDAGDVITFGAQEIVGILTVVAV
jgi:hypothetical protein